MMKYLIILLLIVFSLVNCEMDKKYSCTDFPKSINTKELKTIFEKAKWELYKLNILAGDHAKRIYLNDNVEVEEDALLSSLDLEFKGIHKSGDTTTLVFYFENDMHPIDHSYFHSYSSWGDKENALINLLGRVIYEVKPNENEDAFIQYLRKRKNYLSPWLNCKFEIIE